MKEEKEESIKILGQREQFRDQYWQKRDPIIDDRLLWRAQTLRNLVHLLPGQTILELGCGQGLFTQQLYKVSRGENAITAVTFLDNLPVFQEPAIPVAFLSLSSLPGQLQGREFDFIVAMDILDKHNCASILRQVYGLLKPGGQIVFYESNPWNVILRINRLLSRLFRKVDRRQLLNRTQLYELMSELGFIKVFSTFNDFVYAPLTPKLVWWLRHLSTLFENVPYIRTLAGSILIHAQKRPLRVQRPEFSLCDHEQLKGTISVVVPCHNEEMNIQPLVSKLLNFYGDYLHEIVLVDDNSMDNTKEVIRQISEKHLLIKPVYRTPPNGVGRAIMDGYKAATGKYILSMDCDFQHLLSELRDIFDEAVTEGWDVVIGSRFNQHSVLLNYPYQKIAANRGFHMIARILLWTTFRDLTNNLKMMRREVVESLELTQPGFAINAETGLLPILMGYDVREVPISWINRTPGMGVSSFKLVKVGGGYLQVLIRLWLKKAFNQNSFYPKTRLGKVKEIRRMKFKNLFK